MSKIILITGAARGLGFSIAEHVLKEPGNQVVIWDYAEKFLDEAQSKLSGVGKVTCYVVDISNVDAVKAAAKKVIEEVGVPDVLINNAGIVSSNEYFEADSDELIRKTFEINVLGTMWVTKYFIKEMAAKGSEVSLVNISSGTSLLGAAKVSTYAASKWAINGWTESLRIEQERNPDVHVMMAILASMNTSMFQGYKGSITAPILKTEDVAKAIWKGVKAREPVVYVPKTLRMVPVMRAFLSPDKFDKFIGKDVAKQFESFKVRKDK